jgi:putative transposase
MSNHVHLIAVPLEEESLAKALGRTHSDYARYVNVFRRECGHFWQARFYSCPLGVGHRWAALAYVERNPVRAGIVKKAADYPWSSARAHVSGYGAPRWLAMTEWRLSYTPERWAWVLETGLGEEALRERLRQATETGLPLGDEAFVREWEGLLGRDLRAHRRGRPPRLTCETAAG